MRVLLCGYHEAGYRALRILVARGHEVLVATHPTPAGIPSVAAMARWLEIPCTVGDLDELYARAAAFAPDIVFSVYYRTILPADLLNPVPRGAFNFHPSLLPRHAGCFSAVWAIIEGDAESGVTCHRMIEDVDAGGIVEVVRFPIENHDTGMSLYYKSVDATAALFERVLERAEQGALRDRPQVGARSYHRREVPYGGMIDPSWSRGRIDRFIRALHFPPYPPACLKRGGKRQYVRSIEEYDAVVGEAVEGGTRLMSIGEGTTR